jgi:hypothetical protein
MGRGRCKVEKVHREILQPGERAASPNESATCAEPIPVGKVYPIHRGKDNRDRLDSFQDDAIRCLV